MELRGPGLCLPPFECSNHKPENPFYVTLTTGGSCRLVTLLQELQEQWERARAEEQSRGAGAADVRRWIGIRNTVEAREMLRTLFISACSQRALVSVHAGQRVFLCAAFILDTRPVCTTDAVVCTTSLCS